MTERPTNTQPDKTHAVPLSAGKHAPAHTHEKKEEKAQPTHEPKAEKVEKKAAPKREEVTALGRGLPISLKHSMYVSSFIKRRSIDNAIAALQDVALLRRAVPFKGEIPHRSEPGMMSGRYPQSAALAFIRVLKNLKGNAIAHGLDLEKTQVSYSSASWASRPMRRGGRKAKRVNLTLKATEMKEEKTHHG